MKFFFDVCVCRKFNEREFGLSHQIGLKQSRMCGLMIWLHVVRAGG